MKSDGENVYERDTQRIPQDDGSHPQDEQAPPPEGGEYPIPPAVEEAFMEGGNPFQSKAVMEYLLRPDLPQKYQKDAQDFWPYLDKDQALGNLNDRAIDQLRRYLQMTFLFYKMLWPEMARKYLIKTRALVQRTRGQGGFWTIAQNKRVVEQELHQIVEQAGRKQKQGWFS